MASGLGLNLVLNQDWTDWLNDYLQIGTNIPYESKSKDIQYAVEERVNVIFLIERRAPGKN